jgi:hypothetical protein
MGKARRGAVISYRASRRTAASTTRANESREGRFIFRRCSAVARRRWRGGILGYARDGMTDSARLHQHAASYVDRIRSSPRYCPAAAGPRAHTEQRLPLVAEGARAENALPRRVRHARGGGRAQAAPAHRAAAGRGPRRSGAPRGDQEDQRSELLAAVRRAPGRSARTCRRRCCRRPCRERCRRRREGAANRAVASSACSPTGGEDAQGRSHSSWRGEQQR